MAYATVEKFRRFGLGGATEGVTDDIVESHLDAASAQADLWLSSIGGYTVPLSAWGEDLTRAVCEIAAFSLLKGHTGFNPEASQDKLFEDRAKKAKSEILMMAALSSPHLVSGP
jgi:phage gp36-like protein